MDDQEASASVPLELTAMAVQAAEEKEETTEPAYSGDWSGEESDLLARLAMAEAEGESLKGKELVILVVLNRVQDDSFPGTIEEVIFEEDQFSCITDGRWDSVEPNADCYEAVRAVETMTDDISEGALYFESCAGDSWHSRNLTFLFQEGNHKFYK